jgi:hypothetical protein
MPYLQYFVNRTIEGGPPLGIYRVSSLLVAITPTASGSGCGQVLPSQGENAHKIRSTKSEIRNKYKIRIPNVQN